jgi:hypothetical protein
MFRLRVSMGDLVMPGARVRAAQEGTTVSAKVREFPSPYAQGGQSQ